ncbi:hypothetical protein [Arthrobacter sp. CAN_A1]|uniref:hypothetical protein n=1 Tax=Arthrobacter sp. CAN_A1 TaxID=2787717 RepID=UPI0018C90F9F
MPAPVSRDAINPSRLGAEKESRLITSGPRRPAVGSRIHHFAALAEQLERLAEAEETAAESLQAALG